VDEYLTERERVDWLRARVKEHAPWALAGVAIALIALFGWRQFQGWQERKGLESSQRYSLVIDALGRGDRDGAVRLAADLRVSDTRTPYGDLAEFALARFDAESGKLGDAERRLDLLMREAHDPDLRVVARLRLARVERAEGKLDAALATLGGVSAATGGAAYADVRGDVLADKGDRAGAIAAWQEALATKVQGVIDRDLVALKIASLGGAAPAPSVTTPSPTAASPGGKP
jgi:predicted negative regulator of RcsB-dependent stress response